MKRNRRFLALCAGVPIILASLFMVLNSRTVTVNAAASFVQEKGQTLTATATSICVGTAAPCSGSTAITTTGGDLLVASISMYTGTSQHVLSVTDNGTGNVWTNAVGAAVMSHNSRGELWYSKTTASATSITVTFTAAMDAALSISEYSGVSGIDQVASAANIGTTPDSGNTATLATSSELAVGFVALHATNNALSGQTAGYTPLTQFNSSVTGSVVSVQAAYKTGAGTAAEHYGATSTASVYWAAGVATFTTTGGTPTPTPTPTPPPPGNIYCTGNAALAPTSKIMVILMENKDYNDINGLDNSHPLTHWRKDCGEATNYFSPTHASQKNDMELFSPFTFDTCQFNDSDPGTAVTCGAPIGATTNSSALQNVFQQLGAQGIDWRTYAESMPTSTCYGTSSADSGSGNYPSAIGGYAAKHNPPVYFTDIGGGSAGSGNSGDCAAKDVNMASTGATGNCLGCTGTLTADLTSGLAPLTVLVPNLCSDMHDGSPGCGSLGTIQNGETWLKSWLGDPTAATPTLGPITNSLDYTSGRLTVFIEWDECNSSCSGGAPYFGSGTGNPTHVEAIFMNSKLGTAGATEPGGGSQDGTLLTHLSMAQIILQKLTNSAGLPLIGLTDLGF